MGNERNERSGPQQGRLLVAATLAVLVAGCGVSATSPGESAPSSGPRAENAVTQSVLAGPPADTYGSLRVMQIRRLLLSDDELFPSADGKVLEYVEAATIVDRWSHALIPDGAHDAGAAPCSGTLTDLHRTSEEQTLLALMYVHGQAGLGPGAAEVAVGIASYQQPTQVQSEWESVTESCDGVVVDISGQEFELTTFEHSEAHGLSFIGEDREHHLMGLDNGHNTVTVFAETSREHAQTLIDAQKNRLGVP